MLQDGLILSVYWCTAHKSLLQSQNPGIPELNFSKIFLCQMILEF